MFFFLAVSTGIFSYAIFFLGLLGFIRSGSILLLTSIYVSLNVFLLAKMKIFSILKRFFVFVLKDKVSIILLFTLFFQIVINLIGALGPELGFDALWYHLTIPKIMLATHNLVFIPGSLRFYSLMPKLVDLLYIPSLLLGGDVATKILHLFFGILCLIVLYKLSRLFLSLRFSLLACVIFYTNLVVGWESTSAYIDLGRTFFEIVAIYYFSYYYKTKNEMYFYMTAVVLGLVVISKPLGIGSLGIFVILFGILDILEKRGTKVAIKHFVVLVIITIFMTLPWIFFILMHATSDLISFTSSLYTSQNLLQMSYQLAKDLFNLFTISSDPISPIYIILFPFFYLLHKKPLREYKFLGFYVLLAFFAWSLTPRLGGGRFMLPYLPVFSLVSASILSFLGQSKQSFYKQSYIFTISVILLVAFSSLGYRAVSNVKFIPTIFAKESRSEFLRNNLNFSFGDFYDIDGYFQKNITKKDVVLLYGFHNLSYVNFPFIDSAWLKSSDRYNYIAVQSGMLPVIYNGWKEIYENQDTHIRVYAKR